MNQAATDTAFNELYQQVAALTARRAFSEITELRHGREHLFLANGLMAAALAHALIYIGRHVDALPYAERAAREIPDRWEIFHNLSICRLAAGQFEAAIAAFSRTTDFAERDQAAPDLPARYATLAADYDAKALHQRIPQTMIAFFATLCPQRPWGTVLDLGCGTGLIAAHLPPPRVIDGVDLSREMLEQALRRRLYRQLYFGDLRAFLNDGVSCYNTILAAGVMNYFSDLTNIVQSVAKRLAPGGVFAFATDPLLDPPPGSPPDAEFACTPSGEYCHSRQHLHHVAGAAGLTVREIAIAPFRATPGFWCLFEKSDH